MRPTHHILVIEDDPGIAYSLQDGLKREGYTVTWKANGHDGTDYWLVKDGLNGNAKP